METMDGKAAAVRHPALRAALFAGKFALAGGIIYWLLSRDFHKFVESVSNVRPLWLALAAVLLLMQLLSCAIRWHMLLRSQGIRVPLYESVSLYLQGFFFSLAIPGGAVGGDLVKAGMIAARAQAGKKLEGAISVVVDRITGMVALFGMVLAITPLMPEYAAKLDPAMRTAFLFLLAVSVAGMAATLAFPFHELFFKIKLFKTLSDKADVIGRGAVSRLLEAARLYRTKWRTVLGAVAISVFFANPFQIGALYCLVVGVSGSFPDLTAIFIAALFGGAAAAIPLTPGGIGTRDAICKAGLLAGGIDAGVATAAPLLFTTIFVCISLFGGALFAFESLFKREASRESHEVNGTCMK